MSETLSHVATLLTDPTRPCIGPVEISRAREIFAGRCTVEMLHDGVAVDLFWEPGNAADQEQELRKAFADRPIDIVVQQSAGRRKRLFLADMDSTMIEQECVDELADFVGLKAQVSAITERAMRGEIAFEPALRQRVALLAGLPVSTVDAIMTERITMTPGGRTLVATMKRDGAYTCLVSGGFTLFTGPVAARLGFDENRANRLDLEAHQDGDRLAGTVAEPILGREAKRATLLDLCDRLGLTPDDALAVGDGANDLAMLELAGMGVALHAKPAVAAAARARIDHGDLTALLYIQGYAVHEFAVG